MTVAELQQILRAVDDSAVLVSARILERVLREELDLPNTSWRLPHAQSHVCDRHVLFRHAEQADLELGPGELLPDTVILLARPSPDELSELERKNVLLKYWRRLFHARVHRALGGTRPGAGLSDEEVQARVEAIGPVEFEEVRNVLIQDTYLPEGADARVTYVELASVYLELRYFAASLLPNFFPGIRDFGKVERLLAKDVDANALFAATRLAGAPDPVTPTDTRSDESQEAYIQLVRSAQRASNRGNTVAAAILRMRASRIAPAAQTAPTRQAAEGDIDQLATRLAGALRLSEAEKSDWARHLKLLLEKADQGAQPTEAKVLYDLQNACIDYEKEIYTVDLGEWVMSAGKRSIMQPLPSQRLVRINNDVRAAIGRLNEVRLADVDRSHLTRLMQAALDRGEELLRSRFGPVLRTAMEDVGLRPRGPVTAAAFEKIVAELIDRISRNGFLTFMELRDTLSRNQLKMPDLAEAEDFLRGDPLVRLDRRLEALLGGVYRPSEAYARWLERGTSLFFGTRGGRALTLYILLPLVASWVMVYLLGMGLHYAFGGRVEVIEKVSLVMMGPLHQLQERAKEREEQEKERRAAEEKARREQKARQEAKGEKGPGPTVQLPGIPAPGPGGDEPAEAPRWVPRPGWHILSLLPGAVFVMALIHSHPFRRWCLRALLLLWRQLYKVFVLLPLRLVPVETFKRLVNSWPFQVIWRVFLMPGVVTLAVYLLLGDRLHPWYTVGAVYLLAIAVLNWRPVRLTTEATQDVLWQLWAKVRTGLIVGLIQFIVSVFKQLIEFIEYVLFRVDEWLRFRGDEGRASLAVRTVAGVLWAPVAFLMRFYMVVLVEPGINPVKFPISSLAAKFVYPLVILFGLQTLFMSWLSPSGEGVSYYLAWAVVVPTLFFLPDVFGYLVWEMKENWGLYRANRGKYVRPVAVGAHGETVRGLLQPGFHSGTVPRVFARLRAAERRAIRTKDWNAARAYRREVEEIIRALEQFARREVVALLANSKTFAGFPVELGPVVLGTNRIRIPFVHPPQQTRPVEVELYYHQGWIVARLGETGWLDALSPAQARAFMACLAYLYRLSDVELVYEHLRARLGPAAMAAARIVPEGLEVRPEPGSAPVLYQLRGELEHPERAYEIKRLVFGRTPLPWSAWDEAWAKDAEGGGHPGLPGLGEMVWPWPPTGAAADEPAADVTLPIGPPPRDGDDETLVLPPPATTGVTERPPVRQADETRIQPPPAAGTARPAGLAANGEVGHVEEEAQQGPAAQEEAGREGAPPAEGGQLDGLRGGQVQER